MRPLLAVLLTASACAAAPALFTSNYARFRAATDPLVSYACQTAFSCSGSATAPGTNWTVTYSASSHALGYGILQSEASSVLSGDSSLGAYASFESTGGSAVFQDSYLVTGGTGTGTLRFGFSVTGTTSQTAGSSGRGQFQVTPIINNSPDFGNQTAFSVANGRATVAIPITFGIAREVQIYFYALAQILSWNNAGQAASANLTAVLDSASVCDSTNAQLTSFSIASASGTNYTTSGVVPEPSTKALVLSAAALLIAGRKRLAS